MTTDHFPQLDTARLCLRGFRRSDEAAFAGFATHEEFWRFLPGPALDRELVARFVAARVADAETPNMRDWIFCVEETAMGRAPGRPVGMVRLGIASAEHRQGNIGFSFDHRIRGQGYASEAMRALLSFGFGELGLHRITALADIDNDRSHAVLGKLGFRREGLLRQNFWVRGQWRDSDLFALLRAEWDSSNGPATDLA
ncbi:GNAT family N-acetyltransferase [Ferrovibrio xuzhouensis]|uniref:GNAT family N-acetyltransferase n=1 Tax=Ferrovibrio xuzhouensis TaxID=1576914 RepID=A0ABV7VH19_9PROT